MGITLSSVKKRLDKLAAAHLRCAVHMTPLECAYDVWWTGTPEEFTELLDLHERLAPYQTPLQPSQQFCRRCPEPERLYCLACNQAATHPVSLPDGVLTQAEVDHYVQLASLFERKPPGTPHQLLTRAPIGTPPTVPLVLTPVATPAPAPTPLPAMAAHVEADDQVDAELAAVLAQLTQRLPDDQSGIAQHLEKLIGRLD